MGAEHRGDPAVEVPAHRDLLAGELGMEVDDECVGGARQRFEQVIDGRKRVALDLQVHLAAQVDHRDSHAGGLDDRVPPPGVLRVEVGRPDDPLLGAEVAVGVLVPVGVVAEGDHVDAGVEDRLRRLLGDADATGHVLTVGDHQVGHVLGAQLGHRRRQALPSGLADDIPYEEQAHGRLSVDDVRLRPSR